MPTGASPSARRAAAARRRFQRRRAVAVLFVAAAAGLIVGLAVGTRGGGHSVKPAASHRAGPPPREASAEARRRADTRVSAQPHGLGPIPSAQPGKAEVVSQGPAKGVLALTFDDGWCQSCVAALLQVLARTGAHATICPNGRYGPAVWDHYRTEVRALLARGQLAICNHTFSHYSAPRLSPSALRQELERNERWIETTFGVTSRPYFRPPYGAYDAATLRVAGEAGYTRVVLWSGTLADSDPRSLAYELVAIRHWARPGVIILGHGNYPQTARALPGILEVLRQRHLRTVTLPELLTPSKRRRG